MAARTRSRCKAPSHTEDALASRVRRRAFLLRHFVFARFVPDPSGDAGVASRAQNTTTPTTDKETRERHIHRALTARYPHHTPHPTLTPPPSFAVSVPASLFRLNSSPSKTKKIHRSRRPRFVLALRDGNGPTASSRRASRNFPRIPQTDETQKLQVRRRVCESRGGGFRRTAVPVRLRKLASRRGADEGEAAGRCGELFEPRLKF